MGATRGKKKWGGGACVGSGTRHAVAQMGGRSPAAGVWQHVKARFAVAPSASTGEQRAGQTFGRRGVR
eukprot:355556-Chlamydomonas_euryale.AAC.5